MAHQLTLNTTALDELKTIAAALPVAITIDTTLTQEGQAADAKATGDALTGKADITTGLHIVAATSSDGIAYVATVPGLTTLTTGTTIIIVPNRSNTNVYPTLNINSLGAKDIRRSSIIDTSMSYAPTAGLITSNNAFMVRYDGLQWILVDFPYINASAISGTFKNTVYANSSSQTPATSLLRNSKLVTADTNPTNNGEICWTYE